MSSGGYPLSDEQVAQMLSAEDAISQAEQESLAESVEEETETEDEQEEPSEKLGSGDEAKPIVPPKDDEDKDDAGGTTSTEPSAVASPLADVPASSSETVMPKKKSKAKNIPTVPVSFKQEMEKLSDKMLALKIEEMEHQEALLHEQSKLARKMSKKRADDAKNADKPSKSDMVKAKSLALKAEKEADITVTFSFNGKRFSITTQSGRGIGHMRTLFMEKAKIAKKFKNDLKFDLGGEDIF